MIHHSFPPHVVVHIHGDRALGAAAPLGGDSGADASAGSFRPGKHVAARPAAQVGAGAAALRSVPQAGHGFAPGTAGMTGVRAAMDPHRAAVEAPDRWARYVNAHWPRDAVLRQVFQIDQRTVRNWRNGAHAPRAHHMAMALRQHPEEGFAMLVAAE